MKNSFTTREQVYSNPNETLMSPNPLVHGQPLHMPPRTSRSHIRRIKDGTQHRFTSEFAAALVGETRWQAVEAPAVDESAVRAAIEAGQRCPACNNTGEVFRVARGEMSGATVSLAESCPCAVWRFFTHQMQGTPTRFLDARLSTLKPSPLALLSPHRQQEIIDQVKGAPDESYFLYGVPGSGKTHITTALYAHAVEASVRQNFDIGDRRRTVWRVTASVLLNEHIAWDTRNKNNEKSNIPFPTVSERAIAHAVKAGFRPSLFLDEIDKIVPTEFKLHRLGEIVDAIYSNEGQLVATSNKSINDLAAKWGSDEALTILRRIGVGPRANLIHFAP